MSKTKLFYIVTAIVAVGFIAYSVYIHFVYDPEAAAFLSHKAGQKRVVQVPVWLKVMNVHVAFACIAMAAGLVNFSERVRRNNRKFHKINGYVYVLSVAVTDLTSGYMAPFATGGKPSSIAFNLINIIWLGATVMALIGIKKRKTLSHRKWMVRSYAFCFTNMSINGIAFVLHTGAGMAYAASYTAGVYGTIALLLISAEIVIRTTIRDEGDGTGTGETRPAG